MGCCISWREGTLAVALTEILGSIFGIFLLVFAYVFLWVFVGVDSTPKGLDSVEQTILHSQEVIKFRGGFSGIFFKLDMNPKMLLLWGVINISLFSIHLMLGLLLLLAVQKSSVNQLVTWLWLTLACLSTSIIYNGFRSGHSYSKMRGLVGEEVNHLHFDLAEISEVLCVFVESVTVLGGYCVVRCYWKELRGRSLAVVEPPAASTVVEVPMETKIDPAGQEVKQQIQEIEIHLDEAEELTENCDK